MSYTPRPEDLDELPMPNEWRDVADVVLPGNREQMADAGATAIDAFDAIRGLLVPGASNLAIKTDSSYLRSILDVPSPTADALRTLIEEQMASLRSRRSRTLITTASDPTPGGWTRIGRDPVFDRARSYSRARLIFDP